MKQYFLHVFVILSLFFSSCNYLEIVPENDIQTIETIFEKQEDVAIWLQTCYVLLTNPIVGFGENPAFMGADEVVAGDVILSRGSNIPWSGWRIANGGQMTQEPHGDIWSHNTYYTGIRYCNIFFENIWRVYNMRDDEKALWTAELKALKAHFYFELMRRYGAVILVPENIEANADISKMQTPRSPLDTCVKVIVGLLDEAMEVLPTSEQKDQNRRGYYSLESAAALKAQVLFYAASPLFNGNPAYANFTDKNGQHLFSTTYDHEKWKRAALATEEAIQICEKAGKRLISGHQSTGSKLRDIMYDIERSVLAENFVNEEAILTLRPQDIYNQFWYRWTLPFILESDNTDLLGCISPSMKMVEMYYTDHGLPIDADKEWNYASRYQLSKETDEKYRNVVSFEPEVLGLHLRREPRFYANIAADRCYWKRGKLENENFLVKAYRGEEYGTQYPDIDPYIPQNLSGYWMKKGCYSDVNDKTYKSFEGREEGAIIIRLAELYLMKAEAWNEYDPVPTKEHVYDPLDKVRLRAGIDDVVTAWTNYSKTPDKVKTQAGMREIIRREWNIEFAFEGRRFWNLRRWLTAGEELNSKLYGWNILGKTADQFYNKFEGPIPVWNKRAFISPRDYLFPIRSEEVMVSGCVQNPNW